MQSFFGVGVKFSRGPLTSDEFTARRGDKVHEAMGQEFGLHVAITIRDFVLPLASVVIDGDEIEPRKGDRIIEVDTGEVFEIQPPDNNTPAVELQAGGYEYLVHTKRIE